eukprot:GILJ01012334.1.p2 GENE.GILJ01012334.1~~GILJ01012334.1.p2  ORF type:complete len:173 (-),score=27.44 GILJ01012334.1:139-657(-)
MVPCGWRTDKTTQTSPQHRLLMTSIAVEATFSPDFPIKVVDEEVKNGAALPTLLLIEALKAKHAELDFWVVVGADIIPNLLRWYEGTRVKKELQFIIAPRPGYVLADEDLPGTYRMLESQTLRLATMELSSSEVRSRFRRDPMLVEGLLPLPVQTYIKRANLYRTEISTTTI